MLLALNLPLIRLWVKVLETSSSATICPRPVLTAAGGAGAARGGLPWPVPHTDAQLGIDCTEGSGCPYFPYSRSSAVRDCTETVALRRFPYSRFARVAERTESATARRPPHHPTQPQLTFVGGG